MFKTFTPVYLNENFISVANIYDSTLYLFQSISVSEVEVDSLIYPNGTDLVTALVPVIFVPQGEGSFSQAQIDQNTADILALQTDKADINHNHNSLYYLKNEIDTIISGLPTGTEITSGNIVLQDLIFYDSLDVEVFRVDLTPAFAQGDNLTFLDGVLRLENAFGSILSVIDLSYTLNAPINNIYADFTELIADQSNQLENYIYEVTNANGFGSITAGKLWLRYKGTTNGDETDYEVINVPSGGYVGTVKDLEDSINALDNAKVETLNDLGITISANEINDLPNLIGTPIIEEKDFIGGETNWILSQPPSTSFPIKLYAGTSEGGGMILLDEGIDFTISGSTITYLSPVLPIDPDEKHIVYYNSNNSIFLDLKKLNSFYDNEIVLYGDSITAISNGTFTSTSFNQNTWGGILAKHILAKKMYGRGVGGQMYQWNDYTFWINPNTGEYKGRGTYTFNGTMWVTDNLLLWEDVTIAKRDDARIALNDNTLIACRGTFASWQRIKTMIPEANRNDIGLVLIMGGTNDFTNINDAPSDLIDRPLFNALNTTDPDWIADGTYYNGGDFDLTNMYGSVASTVMKFQTWCPNAVIVLLTPLSGRLDNTDPYNIAKNSNGYTTQDIANHIINLAKYMSIPSIDVYSLTGINQFNRNEFLSDSVHPYLLKGNKALAKGVIQGLIQLIPYIN